MMIRKSFQYRIYPTKLQAAKLQWWLDRCRELYNAALQERRDAYQKMGKSISCYEQMAQLPLIKQDRPEYTEIGSQVLQQVLERLDKGFQAFFRRIKAGQKPGYPRFRNRDRYDSFTLKQTGWKLTESKRLSITGIGALKVRWSRAIEGDIKTVSVRRDADQWYCCFSCLIDIPTPEPSQKPAIGIDVGLESFATLSSGVQIANPRYYRKAEAVLKRRQQSLARKKKGSNRRKKAKLLVAKAHQKIRNQRRDFRHKFAKQLVDAYGVICVEKLNIRGMVHNHSLAKSISDAAWGSFVAILCSKAEGAGCKVVKVDPRGTSQYCHACGQHSPKELSDRWHICDCGASLHRDHNSALIILGRGLRLQAVA